MVFVTTMTASCLEPDRKIVAIGDSTVSTGAECCDGWAEHLPGVINLARGGASSKSFLDLSNWEDARHILETYDDGYLLIQFGHNDKTALDERHTTPQEFKAYLAGYIWQARVNNFTPVLITPVSRMVFDEDCEVVNTHGEYDDVVRELATATDGVLLLDLTTRSRNRFRAAYHGGVIDEYRCQGTNATHFSPYGASVVAEMVRGLACDAESELCAILLAAHAWELPR